MRERHQTSELSHDSAFRRESATTRESDTRRERVTTQESESESRENMKSGFFSPRRYLSFLVDKYVSLNITAVQVRDVEWYDKIVEPSSF